MGRVCAGQGNRRSPWGWGTLCGVLLLIFAGSSYLAPSANAVPAFARKYNMNCNVCHTRFPRLNTFGERFQENGYQIPGTEDGGATAKKRLGELTLNDVTNYLGFRLRGSFNYFTDTGPRSDTSGLEFPQASEWFIAGTLSKNVGFWIEPEFSVEEGEASLERGFVTFNNLGGHDIAHVRLGRFDPSAFWSYSTIRQQIQPIAAKVTDNGNFMNPTITRIGLGPSAIAAKFSGLFDNAGKAIDPFHEALYNSHAEMGVDVHGRPFGKAFLYQAGVLNGAGESFGDSNKQKDWYVMGRLDVAESNLFSASLSGMGYFGNNNAKVSTGQNVDWSRYGVAGNVRYGMLDVSAAYTLDRITRLPAGTTNFDATAGGLTVTMDALVTDQTLLSARYDQLDAGGELASRKSTTILTVQAKHYVWSNLSLSVRDDINLRSPGDSADARQGFRNAFLLGFDLAL